MPTGNRGALFQRRHFTFLAETIRDLGCVTEFQRRNLAEEMAIRLKATNSAFNAERFITAATDTGRTDREPYTPPTVPPPNLDLHTCESGSCGNVATHLHRDTATGQGQVYYCPTHAAPADLHCCTPIPSADTTSN